MSVLLLTVMGITALFFLLLMFKALIKKEFCVLCGAVSVTWMVLLILHWQNLFRDATIIALLLGMSMLGAFYGVEKKVPKKIRLFRLPFLLSLLVSGYSLLSIPEE